ncbi:MAG TPA: hypothetical protein VFT59_00480 [Candidatus Saccharimonadales bacterium]|nr:hypothetical protein [Candidatus Saccharimonadales bacterium]
MHLVPTTEAGQAALEAREFLNSSFPKKPEPNSSTFGLVFFAGPLMAGTVGELLPASSFPWEIAIILLATGILCFPTARERWEWRDEKNRLLISRLRESGDIIELDGELVRRWESLRYKFVLLDEPRADLSRFPDVAKKLTALLAARRKYPDNRTMRKTIDARITELMCDSLKPIEAELDALYDFNEIVAELEEQAEKELRQMVRVLRRIYRDVETELLLLHP